MIKAAVAAAIFFIATSFGALLHLGIRHFARWVFP